MRFGETDDQRAAKIAKAAIRHLVHYSEDPALPLVHRVTPGPTDDPLPGRAVYERMAAEQGLFILDAVQTVPAGFDHIAFLSKVPHLSSDALLACRRTGTRNRHAAGDGPGPDSPADVTKR